jgi:multiple antibiotic resistance protein
MELFLSTLLALFSVINPLGTVPVMVSLTKDDTLQERNRISFFTSLNVLCILLISYFFGKFILMFFGISIDSLRIAGGLIIASSGFALLTGSFTKHKGMKKTEVKEDIVKRNEISLTPLAIPMLAGPGSISMLIALNQNKATIHSYISICLSIIAVCIICYLILRSSFVIVKIFGASGINAISRIIGMILIAMGIEYVVSSLLHIVEFNFPNL